MLILYYSILRLRAVIILVIALFAFEHYPNDKRMGSRLAMTYPVSSTILDVYQSRHLNSTYNEILVTFRYR